MSLWLANRQLPHMHSHTSPQSHTLRRTLSTAMTLNNRKNVNERRRRNEKHITKCMSKRTRALKKAPHRRPTRALFAPPPSSDAECVCVCVCVWLFRNMIKIYTRVFNIMKTTCRGALWRPLFPRICKQFGVDRNEACSILCATR